MLSDLLTSDRLQFADALGWEDAVRTAAAPLVSDGSIHQRYVDTVVDTVRGPGGTYMDLGFGITLAHARPEAGVERTAVAMLHLAEEAHLADDPSHPMRLIVVLAAEDPSSHQDVMAVIAQMLTDASRRERLLNATASEQVLAIVRETEAAG